MKQHIGVRMESDLVEQLDREAAKNHCTRSQMINGILYKHYETFWREDGQATD